MERERRGRGWQPELLFEHNGSEAAAVREAAYMKSPQAPPLYDGRGTALLTMGATNPMTAVVPASGRKSQVALYSLLLTILLLCVKLIVALATHSLGLLAEAAHSGLDLFASLLTWFSVKVAARPADENHPFGHGKFENFSAFLQTGLLLLTAAVIVVTAALNWNRAAAVVEPSAAAFAVLLLSIGIDGWRSRFLGRAARELDSDALAADALNFSSDLWSSVAVLCGLALVAAAPALHIWELRHADAIAACAVAVFMTLLAVRLARRTAGALLDEAPVSLLETLRSLAATVPGVLQVERLRLRRSGSRYFVDLQLAVQRTLTLERAHQVRDEVMRRIQLEAPSADVVVDTRPGQPPTLNLFESIRAIAQRSNVSVHDLSIYDLAGELNVELHVEVEEHLSLKQAHDWVSAIEAEIKRELPQISHIITHIEPEFGAIPAADLVETERLKKIAERITRHQPGVLDAHDYQLRRSAGHLALSFHCSLPDQMEVARVHEILTTIEAELKRALPELSRVTIHPEPRSDNQR